MNKALVSLLFICMCTVPLFSQSRSGISISSAFSMGDLISGEYQPRIVRSIYSSKVQVEYTLVNWDHTIFRIGAGYHLLKERSNRVQYISLPIVFQRFIKSNKKGFNTSLVLAPSFTGGRPEFFNTTIIDYNIELAIRVGFEFEIGSHSFNSEIEFAAPLGSIEKHGILTYVTYGLRFSYYL